MIDSSILHPAFPQPANPNAVIWRYLSFRKFSDLVINKRLYMARADLLGDEHEGTTPAAELAEWARLMEGAENEEQRNIIRNNREQLSTFARDFLPTYYVSCWHMAPDENVAMWDRYVDTNAAVVVRSTFLLLRGQLDPKVINCGVVRYIDYDVERLPSLNLLEHIMHKRHFFSDEREVRAVVWSMGPEDVRRERVEPFMTSDRTGFLAPIDPVALVQGVVLHPKITPDAGAQIIDICTAHGLPKPTPSRLSSAPRF